MANTTLTPTMVTREALRILHEKLSFIGTINRQYDSSFAKSGAKIGEALKIRLPNQYSVRTGKTIAAQDTTEESVTLTVATQKGVDMNFSSAELTLDLDDFSNRILRPAISVLASAIEFDALSGMTKEVYNLVGAAGTTPATLGVIGDARARLNQYLAPKDERYIQLDSVAMASLVNAFSTLQNPAPAVSKQYLEGFVNKAIGFDWYENERVWRITNGSDHTTVTVNDASIADGDSTLTTAGATVVVGTVFTFSGDAVKAVHPETKQVYDHDQQFVITAVDGNNWTFAPALILTGPKQNINKLPTTGQAITLHGAANAVLEQHLAYHKDAFAFSSADLVMPEGVHFASREQFEGISMRIVRAYDINNDNFPCRIDVLYGYKTIRPELACRISG
jgi:hypothetical protein